MNYTNLFPEMLKQLPVVRKQDVCYHYQRRENHNNDNNKNNKNNKLKLFLPYGKKMLLWFVNYDSKRYSIVMEFNEHKQSIQKCFFQYMSFKPELCEGCGTMMWCTKVNGQFCLNKLIYLKGQKYTKPLWSSHMIELKYILENYIHKMDYGSFFTLGLPIMTNKNHSLLLQATSLPYEVYGILSPTNYRNSLFEYMANFRVVPCDVKKDIYDLECKDDVLGVTVYGRAFVNDFKTSLFLKGAFQCKDTSYMDAEYSDDEELAPELRPMILSCVYIPKVRMWKPYKRSKDSMDHKKKIIFIEKKKYDPSI